MKKKPRKPDESLVDIVGKLVAYVKTYESDTFSASRSKITLGEAKQIVGRLIAKIPDRLDGVTIDEFLDDIRYVEVES